MSLIQQRFESEGRVRLQPFMHQVSGSALMFEINGDTICKPMLPEEYRFYNYIPKSLKRFTAQYKGSLNIEYEEYEDGTCEFYGLLTSDQLLTNRKNSLTNRCYLCDSMTCSCLKSVDLLPENRFRLKRSGSVEMDDNSLSQYVDPETKLQNQSRLNKGLTELLNGTEHRFILLENLVAKYEFPSILDLKMGTRSYRDDDSEERRLRKIRKIEKSTSKLYGVRIHGMQKYNADTGKYDTLNRYDGHKFSISQLRSTLFYFLHDGYRLRTELILPIVQRLKEYYDCIAEENTIRFYSSSLLIAYDGSDNSTGHHRIDIRAIDFADVSYHESQSSHAGAGPDEGYLLGIETLINIFSSFATSDFIMD